MPRMPLRAASQSPQEQKHRNKFQESTPEISPRKCSHPPKVPLEHRPPTLRPKTNCKFAKELQVYSLSLGAEWNESNRMKRLSSLMHSQKLINKLLRLSSAQTFLFEIIKFYGKNSNEKFLRQSRSLPSPGDEQPPAD